VLAVSPDGPQFSDVPLSLADSGGKTGWLYGVYLQDEWRLLPGVTVNFGARFDAVDQYTHETQLSPRINVVREPTGGTTVHACDPAWKIDPLLERAPAGGRKRVKELTRVSGLSEDEGHDQAPFAQRRVQPRLRRVGRGVRRSRRRHCAA
jgi:hypothetical protein